MVEFSLPYLAFAYVKISGDKKIKFTFKIEIIYSPPNYIIPRHTLAF